MIIVVDERCSAMRSFNLDFPQIVDVDHLVQVTMQHSKYSSIRSVCFVRLTDTCAIITGRYILRT